MAGVAIHLVGRRVDANLALASIDRWNGGHGEIEPIAAGVSKAAVAPSRPLGLWTRNAGLGSDPALSGRRVDVRFHADCVAKVFCELYRAILIRCGVQRRNFDSLQPRS